MVVTFQSSVYPRPLVPAERTGMWGPIRSAAVCECINVFAEQLNLFSKKFFARLSFKKAAYPRVLSSFFLFRALLYPIGAVEFAEAGDLAAGYSAEDAVAQAFVLALEGGEEIFHFGAFGVAVGGAG